MKRPDLDLTFAPQLAPLLAIDPDTHFELESDNDSTTIKLSFSYYGKDLTMDTHYTHLAARAIERKTDDVAEAYYCQSLIRFMEAMIRKRVQSN